MSYSKLVFKNFFILKLILENTSAAVSIDPKVRVN